MFLEVKIWPRESLSPKRIQATARALHLPIDLVQREVIFYDSLATILELAPVKVILKGGSLISRVYSRTARFSWDIDLTTPVKDKNGIDLQRMSKRFKQARRFSATKLNDMQLVLGLFERDEEKDVFTDLYSLRRPMTTYTVGAPLGLFLRSRNVNEAGVDAALVRLKNKLNGLPMVDYVRATISLNDPMAGGVRVVKVHSLIEKRLPPLRTLRCYASCEEYCLIDKLVRLSQPVSQANLRDQMCDLYDAGQLVKHNLKQSRLATRYNQLYRNRFAPPITAMQEVLLTNQRTLRTASFSSRREFLAVPKNFDWRMYVERTIVRSVAVLERI